MRWSQAWVVARHDLGLFRRRRSLFAGLVALPIGVAIGFPLLVRYILAHSGPMIPAHFLLSLIDSFSIWFVIGGAILPVGIASYSIVGEKVEKSLEPLLATPTTDGEILLGKSLAALVPTLAAMAAGGTLFMILIDRVTVGALGYYYYPNAEMAVILAALCPLTCLFAIETSILISSRVADVRSAQQLSGLIFMPFVLLYLIGEIGAITLDTPTLLEIAGILGLAVFGLFYLTKRTFGREEILTRWH